MKLVFPNGIKERRYIYSLISNIPELAVDKMLQQDTLDEENHLKPIVQEFIARIRSIRELCDDETFKNVIEEVLINVNTEKKLRLPEEFKYREEPLFTYCRQLFGYLMGNEQLIGVDILNKRIVLPDQSRENFCKIISNLAQTATREILESSKPRRSTRTRNIPTTQEEVPPQTIIITPNPNPVPSGASQIEETQEEQTNLFL